MVHKRPDLEIMIGQKDAHSTGDEETRNIVLGQGLEIHFKTKEHRIDRAKGSDDNCQRCDPQDRRQFLHPIESGNQRRTEE